MLQNKELKYVILAFVFSVLVASYMVPAISGFQAHPIFASAFAILIALVLRLIAGNNDLDWSHLLTMIIIALLVSGCLVNLVKHLMSRANAFLYVLCYVGVPTAIAGTIIQTLLFKNNDPLQFQILVITTIIICIIGGAYLGYTHEANELIQSLRNRRRSSTTEETSESQSLLDDEAAAPAAEAETMQSD